MPAATLVVEMGFGFGPNDTVSSWTDVTQWVDLTSGELAAVRGRGAVRGGIEPGALTGLMLDNSDRRWDPTYTAGPYYGNLVPGVPVRVRTTYSATTRTAWSGFVNSGWGQQFTTGVTLVSVTGHDIFGQAAQGSAPVSAWDTAVADLATQPDQWWRPGPDGWIDRVGGLSARHTGGLVEMDALVDGGEKTWGQTDPDGYAALPPASAVSTANRWVMSAWFRVDPDITAARTPLSYYDTTQEWATFPIYAVDASWTAGVIDLPLIQVAVTPKAVIVFARNASNAKGTHWYSPVQYNDQRSGGMWDGRARHIMVAGNGINGGLVMPYPPTVWIDGVQITDSYWTSDFLTGSSLAGTYGAAIGGSRAGQREAIGDLFIAAVSGRTPYVGAIDHVMVWANHPSNDAALTTVAATLYDAGTQAWAGDRMDQRLTKIIDGCGLGNNLGTLDTSGITTQQGYRTGNPLELLQKIEDTEQGRIWCDRDGDLRFSQRGWAWTDTKSTTVQLTLSDDPTMLAGGTAQHMVDAGTVITNDPYSITNVAQVTSTYGRMQTKEDAASIAVYGERNPVHLSGLLHPSDRQSQSIAEWLVYSRSTPVPRVEQVQFCVELNPSVLAPIAQQIEEGWLVRVVKTPPLNSGGTAIGSAIDQYAHVIGVKHQWSGGPGGTWFVTLLLDASRAGRTWFRAGVSLVGGADVIGF